MGMKYKRYYIGAGTTLIAFFAMLQMWGLQINDITGDMTCAGTYEDPCISYFDIVNPTAKSIYIYNYDEVELQFSPSIRYYDLYVRYYGKWHYTNFSIDTRFGNIPEDRKYSFVFPRYSTKHFKLIGYKNNPAEDIKWGIDVNAGGAYLDPLWKGVEVEEKKESVAQSLDKGMQVSRPESWYVTVTGDTEELYDIESATYDGTEFMITLKINETAIDKVSGKELDKIKNTMKVKMRDDGRNSLLATNDIYSDYNKSTGKITYSYKIPADYVTETLVDTYNETGYVNGTELKDVTIVRKEVILKLGENSIYVVATLGTDLKVVQTGLDNTTNYVAGIDVSKGILFSSSDSTDYDLTDGLVLYQSFNHGNYTGTWGTEAIDLSGENNHGTLTNMNIGLDNGDSGWTTSGNQSYGMDFDGVDDYVDCGNDPSLNIADAITISAWVKLQGDGTHRTIYSRGRSETIENYIWTTMWTDNKPYFRIIEGGTSYVLTASQIITEADGWAHLVYWWDGETMRIAINGIFDANTKGFTGTIAYDTTLAKIGDRNGLNFNGTIDEVKIYNRALTPDEISALYSLGQPTHSSNTNVDYLSSSAVTYDTIMNSDLSYMADIPETGHNFTFNPTNIIENQTTVTFNTTDAGYFGQETVTVTPEYLNEQNLTRVRVSNPYAMNQYDLLNFNLTSHLGWNPADILNVWYDSYTGNTDNSTLKGTDDWNTWVDTCESGNTTGLVGCWNFEELDGTTAKDRANNSQNNNDGTLTNMNLGVDNASSGWTRDGKFGNALKFDGDDDYVDIGVLLSYVTKTYWKKIEGIWAHVASSGTTTYIDTVAYTCPAGMAYVHKSGGYCIDKYEASMPNANSTHMGNATEIANRDNPGSMPAESKQGVIPWVRVSQSSARIACDNAGKHLCTSEEWLGAANLQGKIYNLPATLSGSPYYCVLSGHNCVDNSFENGDACDTGSYEGCQSSEGVYDMTGNVWEWCNETVDTLDRPCGSGDGWCYATNTDTWSSSSSGCTKYGGDGTYFKDGVYSGANERAVLRGGDWGYGSDAGPFIVHLGFAPSPTYYSIGFRCCSAPN